MEYHNCITHRVVLDITVDNGTESPTAWDWLHMMKIDPATEAFSVQSVTTMPLNTAHMEAIKTAQRNAAEPDQAQACDINRFPED